MEFQTRLTRTETANVAGLLPGTDPDLAQEVVIFSAHRDSEINDRVRFELSTVGVCPQ